MVGWMALRLAALWVASSVVELVPWKVDSTAYEMVAATVESMAVWKVGGLETEREE